MEPIVSYKECLKGDLIYSWAEDAQEWMDWAEAEIKRLKEENEMLKKTIDVLDEYM